MKQSEELKVAVRAVKAAETVLLEHFGKHGKVEEKQDRSPVTVADKEAEKTIIATIKKSFPEHSFFGEEGGRAGNSDSLWVIDPLDGTRDFTRGMPFFSTEIALMKKGKFVLGVSNTPVLGELLWAERGKGAFLNGKRARVSTVDKLEEAMIFHDNTKHYERLGVLDGLLELDRIVWASRGTPTYSSLPVAAGRAEASLHGKVRVWDVAAATVIVEEAGGRVTDFFGKPVGPDVKHALLTNGKLHETILAYVAQKK